MASRTTPSALCLAWCLNQDPLIIPIPGTRNEHRLLENLSAAGVQFTKEDDNKIRAILKQLPVTGDRYPPNLLAISNR